MIGPSHEASFAGTMTFGQQNCFQESCKILDEAAAAGINFIDAAEMYPVPQHPNTQGKTEEYIGRWLKNRKLRRDYFVLATKVTGPSGQMTWIRDGPKCLDARSIEEAIDNSLLRLCTDYIDLYQIHWPDRYVPMFGETEYDPTQQYSAVPIEEQLEALGRAVNAGKIRYVGVSNETPYGVMEFCRLAQLVPHYPRIVSIQNAYNLLCRNFDAGLAECCHHERVRLLAYSPLAMGLLSGKYFAANGGPADARLNLFKGRYAEGESRYSLSKNNVIAAIKGYLQIAKKYGINPVGLAVGRDLCFFVLGLCFKSNGASSFEQQWIGSRTNVEQSVSLWFYTALFLARRLSVGFMSSDQIYFSVDV